jgi:hypothetical protein
MAFCTLKYPFWFCAFLSWTARSFLGRFENLILSTSVWAEGYLHLFFKEHSLPLLSTVYIVPTHPGILLLLISIIFIISKQNNTKMDQINPEASSVGLRKRSLQGGILLLSGFGIICAIFLYVYNEEGKHAPDIPFPVTITSLILNTIGVLFATTIYLTTTFDGEHSEGVNGIRLMLFLVFFLAAVVADIGGFITRYYYCVLYIILFPNIKYSDQPLAKIEQIREVFKITKKPMKYYSQE